MKNLVFFFANQAQIRQRYLLSFANHWAARPVKVRKSRSLLKYLQEKPELLILPELIEI